MKTTLLENCSICGNGLDAKAIKETSIWCSRCRAMTHFEREVLSVLNKISKRLPHAGN